MTVVMLTLTLVAFVLTLFCLLNKMSKWEKSTSETFECGFSSSFISRFSFSMHFYTVGLIFLFLDLELCFVMPFFNESLPNTKMLSLAWIFILVLLAGILVEWKNGELEWKF